MKKIVILLGVPGSGKGTQAKKIAQKYNYGHISTGDLLRVLDADSNGDVVEKKALADMKAGKLVADWLIYRLAFREMSKYLDNNRGVVLDGAIRNLAQAQKYFEFFKNYFVPIDNNSEAGIKQVLDEMLAIEITLSDEESFNRLTKRRVCKDCGTIIPYLVTTKDLVNCPKCGGELIVRKDDNEEVIRQRIVEQGNVALKPILNYYDKLGVLKRVNGSLAIEKVEESIDNMLIS